MLRSKVFYRQEERAFALFVCYFPVWEDNYKKLKSNLLIYMLENLSFFNFQRVKIRIFFI